MKQASSSRPVLLSCLLAGLLLAACTRLPLLVPERAYLTNDAGETCLEIYTRLDEVLYRRGLADTQAARVPGFPFLRVNRFLASYRQEKLVPAQVRFWLQQSAALDREARPHEIETLAGEDLEIIAPRAGTRRALKQILDECSGKLLADAMRDEGTAALIRERARVPDNYNTMKRVIGLYPFTALFVFAGVERLHEAIRETFNTPVKELPVRGNLRRYAPPGNNRASISVEEILQASSDNPLRIPLPDEKQQRYLLQRFAPVWLIDTVDNNDRFGPPYWDERDRIAIDTGRPFVYRYLSHARFHDAVLLQLNYIIWFPARPASGPFDILSGHLDGLTWRVTLDQEGKPLLYDVMHNCGCYHMFFPAGQLQPRQPEGQLEEPLLVPARAPVTGNNERIVIRVAPATHYIENVGAAGPADIRQRYDMRDYDELRSLPRTNAGARSLFGPDGIIAGTERKERYLLWPMGVLQPGAMRQQGHHATAFIGRRHFDDPRLLEEYFSRE